MPDLSASSLLFNLSLNPNFEPTKAGFGKPAGLPTSSGPLEKNGILVNHKGSDLFLIHGIPRLGQADPAIKEPLLNLIKGLPENKMPPRLDEKGAVLIKNGKVIYYNPEEMTNYLMGFGCYTTSVCVVAIAALANRAADLSNSLINRTKTFNEVTALSGLSKEQSQLVWQYIEFVKYFAAAFRPDSTETAPAFHFSEITADMGKGNIKESDDPYANEILQATAKNGDSSSFMHFPPFEPQLTNELVIQLMKNGTVPMIAYNRMLPFSAIKAGAKPAHYHFKDDQSYHKVVFTGFQSGKYPLRILDVGNGEFYRVRLSSNLDEMNFDMSKKPANVPKYDPDFVNRPFLVYEGHETGPVEQHEKRIFFIDHLNGLAIRTGKISANLAINVDPFRKHPFGFEPINIGKVRINPVLKGQNLIK